MLGTAGAVAAGALAWGLFESQWVHRRRLAVGVPALPPELDGLRILHLSDPHLGSASLNGRALRKAIALGISEEPELAVVTGDLLARPRGEATLRSALRELRPAYGTFAVLGNVDVADTRDPFSGGTALRDLRPEAVLLDDSSVVLVVGGCRVQLVGCAPGSRYSPPVALADASADLRILLAHFPDTADRLPEGLFQLVLSGHTHGGQICLPYPGGKIRFGDLGGPAPPYPEGTFELPGTTLVVSRGLGTTFVPLRFLARPEASVLVLRLRREP